MSDRRAGDITTPRPIAQAAAPHASQTMTLFVMIVATLYFGKEVLMPVTLALLLAFVLAPVVNLLRRAHLGRVPSVLLAVTLALCVVLAIGGVIGSQIGRLTTDIPQYAKTVETKATNVRNYTIGWLSHLADEVGASKENSETSSSASTSPQPSPEASPPTVPQVFGSTPLALTEHYLSPVLSPVATFGIVFVVAVFALLQKEDLRDYMILLIGSDDLHRTTVAIDDGARRLSRYFLTPTNYHHGVRRHHWNRAAPYRDCHIRSCGASCRRFSGLCPMSARSSRPCSQSHCRQRSNPGLDDDGLDGRSSMSSSKV